MWLHFFNEFNCRKVGAKQFNIFQNLLPNWLFLSVVAGQITIQYFFVEMGGKMVRTASLTSEQHAGCIIWGSTVLLVGALLKFLPNKLVEKIPVFVDETKPPAEDKLTGAFNAINGPVTKKGGDKVNPEHED